MLAVWIEPAIAAEKGVRVRSPQGAIVLHGKRILLVISGGIAAYKALDLIRRLRERGCSGHHRVQERQSHGGSHSAQERPTGQGLLGDEHGFYPSLAALFTFIVKAGLSMTPMSSVENL